MYAYVSVYCLFVWGVLYVCTLISECVCVCYRVLSELGKQNGFKLHLNQCN